MLGLAVLFVMIIYFAFLVFITRRFYNNSKNKGNSKTVSLSAGLLGFALVFLPVFWDVIPNRIVFYDLCKNDTQLQVYKTFDEWNAENPDVLEALIPFSYRETDKKVKTDPNYRDRVFDGISYKARSANKRIIFYVSNPEFQELHFHIQRSSFLLFDMEKQEVIAKSNNIYSGPGNVLELGGKSLKIWLNDKCKNNNSYVYELAQKFKALKKQSRGIVI